MFKTIKIFFNVHVRLCDIDVSFYYLPHLIDLFNGTAVLLNRFDCYLLCFRILKNANVLCSFTVDGPQVIDENAKKHFHAYVYTL